MLGLDHPNGPETGVEPIGDLDFVQPLELEANGALGPVHLEPARRPVSRGDSRPLHRADGSVRELDHRNEGVVDLDWLAVALGNRDLAEPGDFRYLAHRVAGLVDHVRAEVAERPETRDALVHAPAHRLAGIEVGRHQEARPNVRDLTELAGLDYFAHEPDGGDEPKDEGALVSDPGLGDGPPHLERLVRRAAQRLFAENVLAVSSRFDGRLGMEVIGRGVDEEPDPRVGDDRAPIQSVLGPSEPRAAHFPGRLGDVGNRDQVGFDGRSGP